MAYTFTIKPGQYAVDIVIAFYLFFYFYSDKFVSRSIQLRHHVSTTLCIFFF